MFTLRQADEADCQLIHALACKVFPHTYRDILAPEQIDYMMQWMYAPDAIRQQMKDGHVYLIAYEACEAAGYVSVGRQDAETFHLHKIYVLPRFQKAHAGRFLFDAAIAYIRKVQGGAFKLELNVNRHNPALGFYEHLGMRKVREGDFDIGNGYYMNDYIMGMEVE